MNWTPRSFALSLVVIAHLAVTVVHGAAHAAADVRLGPLGMAFVVVVIMVAPLAGLVWTRANPTAGAWVIAGAMAAALIFGAVNHFMIPGADHVAHVGGPWRGTFGVTAALLAVTEAAGAWLGLRDALTQPRDPRRAAASSRGSVRA